MWSGKHRHTRWLVAGLIVTFSAAISLANPSDSDKPAQAADALANSMVERAERELVKIRALVESGSLPRSRLAEAEEDLADAKDDAVLARTLYGQLHLQDMTPEEAHAMVDAAGRRVDREQRLITERQPMVDQGILSRADLAGLEEELAGRKRVLSLARNRAELLEQLKEMAAAEKRLEQLQAAGLLKNAMIRYDGWRSFGLRDLPVISRQFERQFHHPLPVSAVGQTLVHQSMGLDHRNRVDVALNPEGTEGKWLRQLLEQNGYPYLAFRSAVAGAATAPHIHLGTGSSRLSLAAQ